MMKTFKIYGFVAQMRQTIMNKLILTISVVLLSIPSVAICEPTLDETLNWLNKQELNLFKIDGSLAVRNKFSFNGCSMTLTRREMDDSYDCLSTIDLSQLDIGSVKISTYRQGDTYKAHTYVAYPLKSRDKSIVKRCKDRQFNFGVIEFSASESLAPRIVKALNNAINLCDKNEPF